MDAGTDGRGAKPDLKAAAARLLASAEAAADRAASALERGLGNAERRLGGLFRDAPAEARDDGKAEAPGTGPDPVQPGAERSRAEGASEPASPGAYATFVARARERVSAGVARGAAALDARAGDGAWRAVGLDARGIRIAREVLRDVVPRVAGERAASAVDGAAMKGGVAGAGLLLRIPLKGFAAPFLLGIAAVEAVRAVREVRAEIADIAARVDNEARSADAYAAGPAG
jgi:hypothetical protein